MNTNTNTNTKTKTSAFFSDCFTVEAVKVAYRNLVKEHHPDLGGDEEIMKQVNLAYEAALLRMDKQETIKADGTTWTYYYNAENEKAAMDKLNELIGLDMEDVEIWLIGTWVWLLGNTKPHKDKLGKNGAKCIWHRTRKCWYWKPKGSRGFSSKGDLNEIAQRYGAKRFDGNGKRTIGSGG